MQRRAAIDIGTNSVKLLVADVKPGGALRIIADEQRTTGLGRGLAGKGRLAEGAIARTLEQVAEYSEQARELGVKQISAAGTAALRNARKSIAAEFTDALKAATGLEVKVLTGEDELELSRAATLSAFDGHSPLVIADIGGGSTEVTAVIDGEIVESGSYNVGASSLTEQFEQLKPFPPADLTGLDSVVKPHFNDLAASGFWPDIVESRSTLLVIQGGSAYCAARLAAGGSGDQLHGQAVTCRWLESLIGKVRQMTESEITGLLSFDPGRAPVFFAGLILIRHFSQLSCVRDFTFSQYSLRHGMLLKTAE